MAKSSEQAQPQTVTDAVGVEWVYLTHPDLEGSLTKVPADSEVVAWQEARGWQRTDPPDETLPQPTRSPDAPGGVEGEGEWVELVHPDLEAEGGIARHQWPNNPDALAGAADAGWVRPNRDGSIPKPATAKRRAKEAQAAGNPPDSPPDTAAADTESPAPERGSRTSGPTGPDAQQDESAGASSATNKEG